MQRTNGTGDLLPHDGNRFRRHATEAIVIHTNDQVNDKLQQATAAAVNQSQAELARLNQRLASVLAQMSKTADFAIKQQVEGAEGEIAQRLADLLASKRQQLLDLIKRQKAALGTFNIVLFGRTGAGKSSLITAFTRTDGSAVSQGESDWTTEVEPLAWHACRIYDTPGINGWGRRNCRDDLEARARQAVEVADFVLVCFDSQSQQADEFAKFAAWVNQYRKPVIAVLNPRNAVWRQPCRVGTGTGRANLSRAVSEHATNIRDELARLGLSSVPVVAISSKRAVFARASLPYKGPDLETLVKHREEYGCEKLEVWSNYGRLEDLLILAIAEGAVELRLGALNDQLRGVFTGLLRSITQVRDEALAAAEAIERTLLEPMLRLVGYPSTEAPERRERLVVDGVDLLELLEQHRGGQFQAPSEGQYAEQVVLRLDTAIRSLRETSLRQADDCIHEAFERGETHKETDVRDRCFNEAHITQEIQAVYDDALAFLQASARLALNDAKLDLALRIQSCAIDGSAGDGWKYSAWAIKGGGVLAGAVGALGGLAAANFWNPLGWGAGAAAVAILAGGVAATLLGWGGGAARKEAERVRLESRRRTAAALHEQIYDAYARIKNDVLTHAAKVLLQATESLLLPPVRNALSLRRVAKSCARVQAILTEQLQSLESTRDAQSLVWEVARQRERHEFPQQANAAALYWLGEDWIDDSEGLTSAQGSVNAGRTRAYDLGFFDALFFGMRGFLGRFVQDVTFEAAKTWLAESMQLAAQDPPGKRALKPLVDLASEGKPRIHLVGDYNTGKSSFIKRLLLDAGLPVPSNLKVAAKPMTDTVHAYDWNGVLLVDSPGFQSSHETHTHQAWDALANASAVIFLLQPNLILGDDLPLRTVIHGDSARGIVDKQDSTYFIVNRSDELGVDPELSPELYAQLVERKRVELRQALASRAIHSSDDRIFFMASDPYGLVGDRVDADAMAFDPYRAWDGFRPFMEALRAVRQDLLASGPARSILQGGVYRLWQHALSIQRDIDQQRRQIEELEQLRHIVEQCVAEGDQIGSRYLLTLQTLAHEQAQDLKQALLAEQDPARLKIRAEQLQSWWEDPELKVRLDHWQQEFSEALEGWQRKSNERIARRVGSVAFRQAFPGAQQGPGGFNDAKGKGWVFEVFDKVGRSMSGATRDVVYGIGKSLGFKFRPWGAVNLAKTLTKVGAVMGVVGVAADVAFIFIEEKRQGDREKARQNLAKFLDRSEQELIVSVSQGSDDNPGLFQGKNDLVASLTAFDGELANEQTALKQKAAAAEEQVEAYRAQCDKALALLGKKGDELE